MTPRSSSWSLLALCLTAVMACAPEDDASVGGSRALQQLEASFGRTTSDLFRRSEPWHAGAEAFVLEPVVPSPSGLSITVPRSDAPIRLRLDDGFEVGIVSAEPSGIREASGAYLVAARRFGASIWTLEHDSLEEWLYLPEGASDATITRYHIQGAEVRQHGRAVDVYDERGRARITMAAPRALDAAGNTLELRLVLEPDGRIALRLDTWAPGPLLVDPVFVVAGSMAQARMNHTAVRLPSGRVLVAGGRLWGAVDDLDSAELFDPATDTWSPAANLPHEYDNHVTELLSDGRAIVFGGTGPPLSAYDEVLDQWTLLPAPPGPHGDDVVILEDGRALVCGGSGADPAYAYDPLSNQWATLAAMPLSMTYSKSARLLSGRVLTTTHAIPESLLYDAEADTWAIVAGSPTPHGITPPILMPDGRLVLASGNSENTTEAFDETTESWSTLSPSAHARGWGGVVLLSEPTRILAVGGYDGEGAFNDSELYDVEGDVWSAGPPMRAARMAVTATVLLNGKVLVAGGLGEDPAGAPQSTLRSAEVLGLDGADGSVCAVNSDCASTHCVDGVCCDGPCQGNCLACTVTLGASAEGVCTLVSDLPCDDHDPCTEPDTCVATVCTGSPVLCPSPQNPCRAAVCNGTNGACEEILLKGAPCPGGVCNMLGFCDTTPDATSTGSTGTGSSVASSGGGTNATSTGAGAHEGGQGGSGPPGGHASGGPACSATPADDSLGSAAVVAGLGAWLGIRRRRSTRRMK